ncbi:MAG: cation diffusion facilitator family transporter [Dehalococcoidia bacterium]|nr:cation diffusion facilitator family transporter [Dehalococcoidia bacterium]
MVLSHSSLVRIAAISLVVTGGLLALKLTLGLISNSIAVISDAVDSGTDLTAGAAALLSVRISANPADEEHPYGHGKVESISAAVAATIIAIGGGFVVFQALRRLLGETPDINVGVGLAAMLVAAGANIVMSFFMTREARRSGSLALRAESKHLETNVVQACAIIAGLLLVAATGEAVLDPIVALGLAAYMGWTAIGLVRTATSEMMDMALPAEELQAIHDVLVAHEHELRGFHRLRTRRSGATRHVDMHVLVDAGKPFAEAHEIGDHIEHEIQQRLPGSIVVVHVEPDDGQEGDSLDDLVAEGRQHEAP